MKSSLLNRTLEFILVMHIISMFYSSIQAQNWAWEAGQSTNNQLGNYGVQGIANSTNCPGARKSAVTWVDASNNLWLFGGIGYDKNGLYGRLNDLWKYNTTTKEWTWVHGKNLREQSPIYGTKGIATATNCPSARQNATGVVGADGNFWLIGGEGLANSADGHLNDLWKYYPNTNMWVWISGDTVPNVYGVYGTQGMMTSYNKLGSRSSSVAFEYNNEIWVVGGYGMGINGVEGHLNDVWKYSISNGFWTWMKGNQLINRSGVYGICGVADPANLLGSRCNHAAWQDSLGNIWIMAGYGYNGTGQYGYLNDLWKYDITNNQWTWIKGDNTSNAPANYGTLGLGNTASVPGARSKSITWMDEYGHLWLFGGYGRTTSVLYGELNDLWQYNTLTNEWIWMGGNNVIAEKGVYGTQNIPSVSNKPGARKDALKWADNNGNFWLMGGYGYANNTLGGHLNDLWKYTPNQAPQLSLPLHHVFCGNTTTFSIPFTVQDLDNDSIHFSISILDTSILSSAISFTPIGGDHYLLNGILVGHVGVTTCMLLAIDEHGAADFSTFDIELQARYLTTANYEICSGDSILIGNHYIKNSGVYQDTLTSYNGCDSLVINTITVLPKITNILYDTILESEIYVFGGNSLTATGIYADTLSRWNGCDSIVVLVLNVMPTNTAISAITTNSAYLKIYPNPSNGQFSLAFKIEQTKYYQLLITDVMGRTIYEKQENNLLEPELQKDILFDLNSLNTGIYIARLVTENGIYVEKMQIVR